MAVINFSAADVLRGKLLEAGWYSFQVARIDGPKPSAGKDSMNYEVILSLIDKNADLNGKELIARGNSKAISMMIPMIVAAQGKSMSDIKPEAFQVDLDSLVGCKLDAKVVVKPYEGQLKNEFESFLPYKKAADAPSFVG